MVIRAGTWTVRTGRGSADNGTEQYHPARFSRQPANPPTRQRTDTPTHRHTDNHPVAADPAAPGGDQLVGALAGLCFGVLTAHLPAPHDAHVFWMGNFAAPWLALPFVAG
jgi:hypothetical protein